METRVKKVYDKYKKIFKAIGQDKLAINDDLLVNIAFMVVTLEDLQKEVHEKGVVEHFIQGKQNFLREQPALKAYNTTIKNFNSSMKILNDLMPNGEKVQEGENLLQFMASDVG